MAVNFTTFRDLNRFANNLTLDEQRVLKATASSKSHKDTYLSYSSIDAEYLPGVIQLLKNHGASVYCALTDEGMPDNSSPERARTIKNQMKISSRLVVFTTTNSKDSKWVPWELGIGDISLAYENVVLLPVANHCYEQSWAKQEYFGYYRHIVHGRMKGEANSLWMVYDYRNNTATKLSEWFRR